MRRTVGGIKPKEKECATSVDRLCPGMLKSTWVNGECLVVAVAGWLDF